MTAIGFVGLGVMGWPMAINLARAGHDVRVYSRTDRRAAACAENGLKWTRSVAEAVGGTEVAITMLPDTPDVVDVATGSGGVLANLSAGALYIDMSTIDPAATVSLHAEARALGVAMLDAPVSGGETGAIEASLSIMVGGERDHFDHASDLLSGIGKTVQLVGGPGAGQVVKAANQLVVAGHLQLLAEALTFLSAYEGIDPEIAMAVIGAGLGGSTVIDRKTSTVLAGNFTPGFRAALHNKDLRIVRASADEKGVVLPATSLISNLAQSLVNTGRGGLDHSALYLLTQELNTQHGH